MLGYGFGPSYCSDKIVTKKQCACNAIETFRRYNLRELTLPLLVYIHWAQLLLCPLSYAHRKAFQG